MISDLSLLAAPRTILAAPTRRHIHSARAGSEINAE